MGIISMMVFCPWDFLVWDYLQWVLYPWDFLGVDLSMGFVHGVVQ